MEDVGIENFKRLKPACVALSQVSLKYRTRSVDATQVINALILLHETLESIAVLEFKLCEYVFFPLSIVFHEIGALPPRATGLSAQCLSLLLAKGWAIHIKPPVAKQILILLSHLLTQVRHHESTEESLIAVLDCVTIFFQQSSETLIPLCQTERVNIIPTVGRIIDCVLVVMVESTIVQLQLASATALLSIILSLQDTEILRKFLPGIVSQLTKVLTPGTQIQWTYRPIVICLQAVQEILKKTMSDSMIEHVNATTATPRSSGTDQAWTDTTSAQVKLALTKIVRLKRHKKHIVLETLFSLCTTLLTACKDMLRNCATLLLETSISVYSEKLDNSSFLQLQDILSNDEFLLTQLRSLTRTWLSSLPRMVQGNNNDLYHKFTGQISTSYTLFGTLGADTSVFNEVLGSCLCEIATIILHQKDHERILQVRGDNWVTSCDVRTFSTFGRPPQFRQLTNLGKSQEELIVHFETFLRTATSSIQVSDYLLVELEVVDKNKQLPLLWLLSRALFLPNPCVQETQENGQFLLHLGDALEARTETLFSFALEMLAENTPLDCQDWRREGIALEIVASRAQELGRIFRPNLVDALFPITERLGSSNSVLQEHAIVCLGLVSQACGYSNVGEMIVQNADYLVNSIALKLNTFNLSPQVPLILVMLLELSGPSLLPYISDLVESILSLLASFHGYSTLVKALWSVLSTIVNQASRASSTVTGSQVMKRKASGKLPMQVAEVIDIVKATCYDHTKSTGSGIRQDLSNFDHGQTKLSLNHEHQQIAGKEKEDHRPEIAVCHGDRSYTLVQSIIRLSQHYLSHESPYIRQHLLELVAAGCLSQSRNEDEFLPLINDIWPTIIKRLYDVDNNVRIAAMQTLSAIFSTAGDFVSTRVNDEWPEIRDAYHIVAGYKETDAQGRKSTFVHSNRLHEKFLDMLLQLLSFVRLSAEMEDELLEMLSPLINTRSDIEQALGTINPDAVWLLRYHLDRRPPDSLPQVDGYNFKAVVL